MVLTKSIVDPAELLVSFITVTGEFSLFVWETLKYVAACISKQRAWNREPSSKRDRHLVRLVIEEHLFLERIYPFDAIRHVVGKGSQ